MEKVTRASSVNHDYGTDPFLSTPVGHVTWCRPSLLLRFALAAIAWLLLAATGLHAQQPKPSEYQVKAAYLYNFTKYVEWPPDAFHSADDPTVICVIGDDRTGKILEQVTVGKKANGRRVEARNPHSANEFRACQVLFIGFADKDRIAGILRNLRDSNVLVVGQTGEFLSLGGMINLVQKNGAIELEIDTRATDAAGLKVSSRLLVVSRIVSDDRPAGVPR